MEHIVIHRGMLNPKLILTAILFLLVAPAPDSLDISEMTANFIVSEHPSGLMASADPVRASEEDLYESFFRQLFVNTNSFLHTPDVHSEP